jgi:ABC-2 type transport system ATP-binding protein
VWYCGGHGACITGGSDGTWVETRTLQWLDKYVKGLDVSTGPQFEWVDQRGDKWSSSQYPVPPAGTPLTGASATGGNLALIPLFGGSGPNWNAFSAGPIGGLLGFLSGSRAPNAVEATATAQELTYVVGAPNLKFTYTGSGTSTHLYAQLIDNRTGLVIGNQVTPVAVTLDGQQHEVDIPLEMIAHTMAAGDSVTVQIVASAVTYQPLWTSGVVNLSNIQLSLPTADASAVVASDFVTAAA